METKKQYNYVLSQGFVLRGGKRDYVVEQVLGKGGFGVTYKVIGHVDVDNIDFDAPFAVKEYFPDICSREADNATIKVPETKQRDVAEGLKDFVNEARRLQETCKLNHNIVNVNEVFEANGTAYYVLEYLGGGDLRKRVKESPDKALTEQQMLELMLPVGKAVQCLHENHILHLDIKPDNIVMRKGRKGAPDEPVLIDFGLATHFNNSGVPTSMTPSQGISAGYSPIEQYSLLRQFEPRLDVYAFSATCLYLLTGKDPAEALSMPAFFDDSIIPSNVSERVRQAIKHGMSKEKDFRTPTIKKLLEELQGEKGEETILINVQSANVVDANKTIESHRKYPYADNNLKDEKSDHRSMQNQSRAGKSNKKVVKKNSIKASKVKLLHQEMMLALDHKATNKTLKLWAISLILSIVGFFLLMYAVAKIGGCENSGSEPSRGSDSTAYEEQWQQQSVPASYASEEYEQAAEAEPAIEYQYSEEKTAAE